MFCFVLSLLSRRAWVLEREDGYGLREEVGKERGKEKKKKASFLNFSVFVP